jgi:GlpG protein
MRQAGTLSNRDEAQRLADYLLTLGISARVDPDGDAWAVWIREEDQLPLATKELQQFLADPKAERYCQATQSAETLRKQQSREEQSRRKNMIEMRDRWDTSPSGRRPLTVLLIAACIFVAIATDAGERKDSEVLRALWFAPPPTNMFEQFTWTPIKSINEGQVWRLVTPIFIHFGPWHLLFNMLMFYSLGSLVEVRRGSVRFGFLVLVLAVAANYSQYFFPFVLHWGAGSLWFGGMSGVVYGLFGYVWMKSRFDPQAKMFVPPNTVAMLLVWLLLGWSGALEKLLGSSIANWEHTIGLIVGVAIGLVPVAWRELRKFL